METKLSTNFFRSRSKTKILPPAPRPEYKLGVPIMDMPAWRDKHGLELDPDHNEVPTIGKEPVLWYRQKQRKEDDK